MMGRRREREGGEFKSGVTRSDQSSFRRKEAYLRQVAKKGGEAALQVTCFTLKRQPQLYLDIINSLLNNSLQLGQLLFLSAGAISNGETYTANRCANL
jgi:hypothetical protein